ncbi:S28 family serine protease [Corallococcus silvisoli]|uniref:S28 family serine protease n=1 Tax=Corallococcus silvisoli TaxID=2697031 RepID=UPI0013764F3F|nr:S28 family serine protease [Corallococcus silvisoli]NBD08084.1 multidrug transporter [Corallococcus silvisoli]
MVRVSRLPRLVLLLPLLTLLGTVACGDDEPTTPTPDSGSHTVDAGTDAGIDAGHDAGPGAETDAGADAGPELDGGIDAGAETDAGTEADAGTDAGTVTDAGTEADAGTDGGVACTPSGWVDEPADLGVITNRSLDILVRLRAIPGLAVQENPNGVNVPTGYRLFVMKYNQPADHAHPECQRFEQRVTLMHTSDAKPMVLYTGGYNVSVGTGRSEPAQLLAGNQIALEHRFFPPSIPTPADWSHLTIRQSADDFHRITQALKPIYTGKWVSTGGSKGGETVVFFRRFYPDDVDATVAYVAPIARRDDERFPAFQDTVGGAAQAACRERLWAFQREVLSRRERMLALVDDYARTEGLTYTQLGRELVLEHAAIETYFAFWQYDAPSRCTQNIPDATATDQELFDAMDYEVGMGSFADSGIAPYAAYYYQSALELGWPQPYEAHLGALIHFPGTDTGDVYSPPGIPFVFRPQAMPDIQDWVSTQGNRLMFIYGSLDPWTAAAYSLGSAQDSYYYTVQGGNHGARISLLPTQQQAEAKATLNRWMGVAPLKRAPKVSLEDEPPLFAPRLPPRLREGSQP